MKGGFVITLPKLYKKTSAGKIQEWEIEISGAQYRSITGQSDGKKIVNAWTTCEPKNIGRSNETTAEEQAILEATSKWTAQKDKHHYVEDIASIEEETFYKVMLAKSYTERKSSVVFPALYNDKLDGCRFVARKSGGHSRNGKPLGGMFIIMNALKPFFEKYPDAILDGEAFSTKYKDNFQECLSLITRDEDKTTSEQKQKIEKYLEYHIYDCPRINGLTEKDNYTKRFECFWNIINTEFPELNRYLKRVDYTVVKSHEEVQKCFERSISEGFEGGILRWDVGYENKRTWNLLKIKEFKDEEFEIVEVLEGNGSKAGTAGSMTLKLPNGTTFNSNIKGGFELYDRIWAERTNLIGKMATCKFFDYSNDGIPRFPYVINIDRGSYE